MMPARRGDALKGYSIAPGTRLAVPPLATLGAEHKFLGGSLIEELIHHSHSKLSGLRVAGRSAVFQLLHPYLTGAAS